MLLMMTCDRFFRRGKLRKYVFMLLKLRNNKEEVLETSLKIVSFIYIDLLDQF